MIAFNAQAFPSSYVRNNLKGGVRLADDSVGKDTWKDYVDAFLEGSTIDEIVANSTECVHDIEDTNEDMTEAITHFIKRGWSLENWFDLNGALGDFTPLIRTCYDVGHDGMEDAKTHFGKFDSLVDFAEQARDNAIIHSIEWFDVVAKFNEAFSKKKGKDIAFQAGRAITLFLNFDARGSNKLTSSQPIQLPDLHWLENLMQGFLNGTQVLSSQRVKNCVNETLFMVDSITDANVQFAKKTDEGFREGVFELGDMFAHLKPLNEECYYGVGDIEATIQKYIKSFKTPIDILFNALKHFNEISVDVISVMQHYNNKEWYDLGFDLGDIFYNVFFDQ